MKAIPVLLRHYKKQLIRVQQDASIKLSGWYERLSRPLQITIWLALLGGGSAYSARVIYKSLRSPVAAIARTTITHPQMPRLPPDYQQGVKTGQMELERYNRFMDSLSETPRGRLLRDSLLRARPGLPDSVRLLQEKLDQ